MSKLIISVSGLRGIVGETLTPEVAIQYISAFSDTLPPGDVVVTRDGRQSGEMLATAVRAGLMARGRTCIVAGVAATPTTGVLVRQQRAAGGIQVSASHNPPEYNGLKLFNAQGRVIPATEGQQVLTHYHEPQSNWKPHNELGQSNHLADTVSEHLRLVTELCNVDRIRSCRFRVLLDANHGSGSVLGAPLLEELGCQATILGDMPDGQFAHPAEPTEENLNSVAEQAQSSNADVVFCQDPDADRLAVIDSQGRYLGEEATLAMCVDHVLRQTPGPVVTNCSTSRMTQDLAEKYGVAYFRSAVGEANVVDLMLQKEAVLGGEGNGGVIEPRVGLVRDSFVGMALLLDAMAARQLPIDKLAAELPQYAINKWKVTLPAEQVEPAVSAMIQHFSDAASDRLDGLRLDWPDKWLLIRASNTEPIVRIVAEAINATDAQRLCDEAANILQEVRTKR